MCIWAEHGFLAGYPVFKMPDHVFCAHSILSFLKKQYFNQEPHIRPNPRMQYI